MARKTRSCTDVDQQLGFNIRYKRIELGYSSTQLASKIDITHQQLHKYEKGVDRVSAGRLVALSNALECSVTELLGIKESFDIRSRLTLDLMRNFSKLTPKMQQAISDMVVECASNTIDN